MNSDAIFNSISKANSLAILKDQIAKKRKHVQSVESKTCGNCSFWMKSSCEPEKKHGQFKSSSSLGCSAFSITQSSKQFTNDCRIEISELRTKIKTLKEN